MKVEGGLFGKKMGLSRRGKREQQRIMGDMIKVY
jgi:hypothetical protein